MAKNIFVLGAFLIFCVLSPLMAQQPADYCSDPQVQAQWDKMSAKYPHDDTIQTLHALWIGLCVKVKRGDLELNRAVDLFERARAAAIRAKQAEEEKGKKRL